MADNAELIAEIRALSAAYRKRYPDLPGDEAEMLEGDAALADRAADALEAADAKIAELTEIVESVRHIQALKTFVNAKVKKLQALNRRLR